MNSMNDYRVVIGIDFGTTHSGFAYAYKKSPHLIYTKVDWGDYSVRLKVPTVLLYDDEYVQSWGFSVLAKKPGKIKKIDKKPVELFKLHLGNMPNKPPLPDGLDYKKAITDYLYEFGKVIKDTIDEHWVIDFYTQTLIILTIPAEFDNMAVSIMRECAFNAGLSNDQYSPHLRFITEPKAAAIHCMKTLKEHNLSVGSNFMVVDCGGGTVNLTSRKLLEGERLSEITEITGDFCGGSFVDQEFLKFLELKVGSAAMNQVKEKHYIQLQYMIQEFCKMVKVKFTGVKSDFQLTELDLDELCPALERYCEKEYLSNMDDWTIILKFEDVKAMFDPVIKKIIQLVDAQLRSNSDCSALFLVGGFSESKYLQLRIKQTFSTRIPLIAIPPQPVTAVIKGAVEYGLDEKVVNTHVLKWTYGTDIARKWQPGDPEDRRRSDGRIIVFERLAKRGTQLSIDHKVNMAFSACNVQQRIMGFDLYVTKEDDAKFCDESHVKLLGKWSIELPRPSNEEDRPVLFTMTFSNLEIKVTAVNSGASKSFKTSFKLDSLEQSLQLQENEIQEFNNKCFRQISDQSKIKLQEQQNIDQLQQSLILKENQIKEIEEQHLEYVQQLESISDYQNKITLQEQNISQSRKTIDQLQQSLELKENQIKEIEKKHLSSVQQLEDQISNISQQYQSKITLQEQSIDQLQQSLKLKVDEIQESNNDSNQSKLLCNKLQEDISNINQQHQNKIMLQKQKIDQLQQLIQNSEMEKEELNAENNLHQKITNLENKLKNLSQKNVLLEDEESNYQLEDSDQIYVTRLINNIVELNNNLKNILQI